MFTTDFFLLPFRGTVLGMQWLKTLGPVLWDFVALTMFFTQGVTSIMLKGLNLSLSKWVEGVSLTQLTKIEMRGTLLQIS